MALKSDPDQTNEIRVAAAMRKIRTNRRLRASDVARAMDISPRTYDRLEAGLGPMDYERMVRFARATSSDPVALLVAPLTGPEFPARCADNKLMMIAMLAIGELAEELGEDLPYLETRTLINAFSRLTKDLAEHFAKRDMFAETWVGERAGRIEGLSSLLPKKSQRQAT